MNKEQFINSIAEYVLKYGPQYGILVYSPIIAQACLESAYGTSELAVNAHNYFGLKYRDNRCSTSCGIYYKNGSEQNPDGSYTTSAMQWFKFPTMEAGVIGYFDFTNISNYSNLKGVTDPQTYLENIKADKYATSIDYVQKVMNVITSNNLTRFDIEQGEPTMIFNIHAGHNPDGKVACGAIGLIKESTEARNVKNEVIRQLQFLGHTVYDCTVDDGTSQSNILSKIVSKCNSNPVNVDVSIHFNSGANDKTGNGKSTGTEVFIYKADSKAKAVAQNVVNSISALGFKNRGVKVNSSLYVLKNTKSPAILIECCFVDDADDVKLYTVASMADAIVYGLTGQHYKDNTVAKDDLSGNASGAETKTGDSTALYRVQVGAFRNKENAEKLVKELKTKGYNAFITT